MAEIRSVPGYLGSVPLPRYWTGRRRCYRRLDPTIHPVVAACRAAQRPARELDTPYHPGAVDCPADAGPACTDTGEDGVLAQRGRRVRLRVLYGHMSDARVPAHTSQVLMSGPCQEICYAYNHI